MPGDYEISLIVFNGNCYDTLKKTIHVLNMQIAVPEEPEEKEEIKIVKSKVYPNPTQGQITLEVLLNQSASLKVRMYDFNGRMVMFDNLNGLEIQKMMNLSSLKSGMYFIVLNTEDQQYTHKVILHPH